MGIYDSIMQKVRGDDDLGAVAPPGIESVSATGALPPLSPEAFKLMFGEDVPDTFGTVTSHTGPVNRNDPVYEQSMMLPTYGSDSRGAAMHQEDRGGTGTGLGGSIARLAKTFVGTPYVWGGSSPSGFDCSGFVQYVYKQMGVNLPRVSFQQANSGPKVSIANLKPGDLVAWNNSTRNPGADHIAIYLGGGLIAEAPRPGVKLRIRKLGKNEGAWGVRVL